MNEPSNEQASPEEMVKKLYLYAARQLSEGQSRQQVMAELEQSGLEPRQANQIVTEVAGALVEQERSAGRQNMVYGVLWCVGGLIVTGATYSFAWTGGGRYVVAWGAVAFGAVQFIRGAVQANKSV